MIASYLAEIRNRLSRDLVVSRIERLLERCRHFLLAKGAILTRYLTEIRDRLPKELAVSRIEGSVERCRHFLSAKATMLPQYVAAIRDRLPKELVLSRVDRVVERYRRSLLAKGATLPRLVIARLGMAVICAIAILPTIGYGALSLYHLRNSAYDHAGTGARNLEVQLILRREVTSDVVAEIASGVLYATRDANPAVTANWVTDSAGQLITFDGESTYWPEATVDAPIRTPSFNGTFFVTVSLGDVIIGTFWNLVVFSILALIANYCFHRLALGALDDALQRIGEQQAAMQQQKYELAQQNLRFASALGNMSQGLAMFDKHARLTVCNDRYREMYGLTEEQVRPGTPLKRIVELRIGNGIFGEGSPDSYRREMFEPVTAPVYKIQSLSDGRWVAVSRSPMADGGWVATHQDVTEQRLQEQQIAFLARHDLLTQLPNRAYFNEQLENALRATSRGLNVAVMYLDLDHFKDVNDSLGHHVGDDLLNAVATRLRKHLREQDIVARLGGDEFAVIQTGGEQPRDAAITAARLIEAVGEPYEIGAHRASVGLSIGIAVAPLDGKTAEAVLQRADVALYEAKKSVASTFCFFEPAMGEKLIERRELEHDLRVALDNREFMLQYQPIVRLADDTICGFEALIRWRCPKRGNVSPSQFIPIAEEIGLIEQIGEWVLREACREAADWASHIRVAVNVSANQLSGGRLLPIVISALGTSGLPPQRLELEVTESIFMGDSEQALRTLQQLRTLGVRIALDDFGVGYSSLGYLRRFAFDKIKLDRYFVGGARESVEARAIVHAVADLGTNLGISTTAEGIETADQLDRVRGEGYTEVQGYFLHRPVAVEEARKLAGANMNAAEAAADRELIEPEDYCRQAS